MSNRLSEKQVLNKLGIDDFTHLSKAKFLQLIPMIDKMDPEVAKKVIEQFPEFTELSKEILQEYKDIIDNEIASNDKSMQAVYYTHNTIISSLQKELDKDCLSFEEKQYIIEKMTEISKDIDLKDSENKKFLLALSMIGGSVLLGGLTLATLWLGNKIIGNGND